MSLSVLLKTFDTNCESKDWLDLRVYTLVGVGTAFDADPLVLVVLRKISSEQEVGHYLLRHGYTAPDECTKSTSELI